MLPLDVSLRVLEASPPETWKAWLLAYPPLRSLLSDTSLFWRQQCHGHDYPGYTLEHFKRSHHIQRNWQQGRYRRQSLPIAGQICYFLSGKCNRALSATLAASESYFWDLETGTEILRGEGGICCASLEGDLLVYGSRDGRLALRDTREARVQHSVVAHHGQVSVLKVRHGILVTGSSDGTVKVWDVRRLHHVSAETAQEPITGVAISRHSSLPQIAYSTASGRVKIVGHHGTLDTSAGGAINCLRFRGDALICGSDDGSLRLCTPSTDAVRLIDTQTASPIISLHAHRAQLVAGHANGLITCHQLDRHPAPTSLWIADNRSIIWSIYNDRERIISSSLDNRLYVHAFTPE